VDYHSASQSSHSFISSDPLLALEERGEDLVNDILTFKANMQIGGDRSTEETGGERRREEKGGEERRCIQSAGHTVYIESAGQE